MGAKFQNSTSPSFDTISTKLYDKHDSHGGIQANTFLAMWQ